MSAAGFTVIERFDAQNPGWTKYIAWSGLTQLVEVIGLDQLLCSPLLDLDDDDVWPYVAQEALPDVLALDVEWLRRRLSPTARQRVLYVVKEPDAAGGPPDDGKWDRAGYELLEHDGTISALTNCGGFSPTFERHELNRYGLLDSIARAREVRNALPKDHAGEPHAVVDIFEIWFADDDEHPAHR